MKKYTRVGFDESCNEEKLVNVVLGDKAPELINVSRGEPCFWLTVLNILVNSFLLLLFQTRGNVVDCVGEHVEQSYSPDGCQEAEKRNKGTIIPLLPFKGLSQKT